MTRFTPDRLITVSESRLSSLPTPPGGGLTIVQSAWETGKTHTFLELAKRFEKVVIANHRVSLSTSLATRSGFKCYRDVDAAVDGLRHADKIVVCLNSLLRVSTDPEPKKLTNGFAEMQSAHPGAKRLFVLDEATQCLRHLFGGTIREAGPDILQGLLAWMRCSQHVVVADADLDDDYIAILAGLFRFVRPDDPIWLLKNGHVPDWTMRIYERPSDLHAVALAHIDAGKKLVYATVDQNLPKLLSRVFEQLRQDSESFWISGLNSKHTHIQNAVANINDWISDVDLLTYSPAMVSGVSIDVPGHFDHILAEDRYGLVVPTDLLQMAVRCRRPKSRVLHLHTPQRSGERPTSPRATAREVIEKARLTFKHYVIPYVEEIGEDEPPPLYEGALARQYLWLWAQVSAKENRMLNNPFASLVETCRDRGFPVEILEAKRDDTGKIKPDPKHLKTLKKRWGDLMKDARATSEKEYVEAVVNAPDIDDQDYQRLAGIKDPLPEDDYARRRFEIQRFYEVEDVTAELVKFDDHGRMRPKIRNFVAVKLQQDGDGLGLTQFDHDQNERKIPLHLRGTYAARAKLLDFILRAYDWKLVEPIGEPAPARLYNAKVIVGRLDILLGHPDQYEHHERHLGNIPRDWREKPIRMLNLALKQIGERMVRGPRRKNGPWLYRRCLVRAEMLWRHAQPFERRTLARLEATKAHIRWQNEFCKELDFDLDALLDELSGAPLPSPQEAETRP